MAISKKAHEILNRPDLIERRDMWFKRMRNVYDSTYDEWGKKNVFTLYGALGRGIHDPYKEPEKWVEECLEDLAERIDSDPGNRFYPYCVEYGIYGVHYVDKIFKADVFFKDGQWNVRYINSEIGSLPKPDLDLDETWNLTRRTIDAFNEADVKLPLFGLPTIASTLNIAINLYGQDILVEMMIDPDNASKDLVTINDTLIELHQRCRSLIPEQQLQPVVSWERTQPPGFGQLCGCSTQLISKELYAELIAPLDDKLLSVYPNGGMIHICGAHTQHVETFRNMKSLRALQFNDRAAADLKFYYDNLRPDQVFYIIPCKECSLEQALEATEGGNRLVIVSRTTEPILKK